jgi:hypothetical protein
MDNTQLAELLMGNAKDQNAVIDAIERAEPGFRNNHAIAMLTTAANVRAGVPRLQDLPSRILLRMQGRAAFDVAAIQQDLEHALAAAEIANAAPAPAAGPEARAAAAAASRPLSSDVSRPAPAAPPAAAPAPRPAPAAAPGDDLDFSAKG